MSERLSPNAARLTCKSTDRMTASVRTTSMDRLTLNVLLSEIELPHRRPEMSAQQLVEEGFPTIPVKELDQTAEVSG